ncbi:MAG: hypothetical protein WD638_08470 [Nitriliruptoraceae bacterium]
MTIERDVAPFLAELTRDVRDRLTSSAPELTFVVHTDELPVAVVRAVRLRWDGTPGDAPAAGAVEAVARAGEAGADTLTVLDVTVAFGERGRGLGGEILAQLDGRRRAAGLERLLVLLRPHAKASYPLIPFARYAAFRTADGAPFDPWLRTAWRQGFHPVRGVDRSLVARADLDAWRRWLDAEVPGSGPYLVDGAIKPAILETERDEGRYREPHLWATRPGPANAIPPADPSSPEGWVTALAVAGVRPGDRSHREGRRERS